MYESLLTALLLISLLYPAVKVGGKLSALERRKEDETDVIKTALLVMAVATAIFLTKCIGLPAGVCIWNVEQYRSQLTGVRHGLRLCFLQELHTMMIHTSFVRLKQSKGLNITHSRTNKKIDTYQGSSQEFLKEYTEGNCGGARAVPPEKFLIFEVTQPYFCILSSHHTWQKHMWKKKLHEEQW